EALEAIPVVLGRKWPFVTDNAHQTRNVLFYQQRYERRENELSELVEKTLTAAATLHVEERQQALQQIINIPQSVFHVLVPLSLSKNESLRQLACEVLVRRVYDHEHQALKNISIENGNG